LLSVLRGPFSVCISPRLCSLSQASVQDGRNGAPSADPHRSTTLRKNPCPSTKLATATPSRSPKSLTASIWADSKDAEDLRSGNPLKHHPHLTTAPPNHSRSRRGASTNIIQMDQLDGHDWNVRSSTRPSIGFRRALLGRRQPSWSTVTPASAGLRSWWPPTSTPVASTSTARSIGSRPSAPSCNRPRPS